VARDVTSAPAPGAAPSRAADGDGPEAAPAPAGVGVAASAPPGDPTVRQGPPAAAPVQAVPPAPPVPPAPATAPAADEAALAREPAGSSAIPPDGESAVPPAGGSAVPPAGDSAVPPAGDSAVPPDGPVVDRDTGSPTGRRVRARLARLTATKPGGTPPVLEPLHRTIRVSHPKADVRPVQRAYEVAERAHEGQQRRSGDAYITHPLAVTTILAELGMDTTTLVAALLHDVVEDTPYTLGDVRKEFGDDVAHLVDGVTKLDKVQFGDAAEAETIRKMVVAMARDARVLVIKLADRLHNMRTLRFLPPEKQERKARETLEIYAPLAHRLGMNTLKWELEDLAFATLYPKRYDEIVRLVADRAPARDTQLTQVVDRVSADLKTAKIRATVTGRPKHYYSIYQKMIVRGRDFTDIYDLVGIRVLVDSVRDCYAALGTIHALWSPVPGRFKDYIAMPKFNMYQSLHTTVIGPSGKPVEIQIRTVEMHKRAEYGIAAHWKYKEGGPKDGAPAGSSVKGDDMAWLRQLLDWQKEAADPGDFLDSLRYDLHSTEVFVFTPKGDVLSLPAGSTPVDFAYAVHTEVGHRCIGARVNGRLVPLESTLDNGDVVEVFTSKAESAHPSQDWLQFVKSPRARNKIRQWFAKERREDAVEAGKEALARAVRKQGLPLQRILGGEALPTLVKDLRLTDVTALYVEIGEGRLSAQSVVHKIMTAMGGSEGAAEDLAETAVPTRPVRRPRPNSDPGVVVKGVSDVWVKLARCCTPVPGDQIVGFVTRGNGVSVHRGDCVNAGSLMSQEGRVVEVEWAPTSGSMFLVAVQVEALDRTRLLSDITRMLSDAHINILSASVTTTRDRVAVSRFTFEMGDPKHLGHLLNLVRAVEGVYDAYRVTN
jgi:GTP diphosphokinase / guanosine-3',5'-bis(diphosphate) 3'-diphosphatase